MQSTLSHKPGDDPCDDVVIAPDDAAVVPDAVRVAPSDEELSSLLHQAARHRSDAEKRAGLNHADLKHAALDFKPDAMVAPVDAVFRPSSANGIRGSAERRPLAARAARAVIALLLGAGISLAAVAWKSYGEAAKKTIAALTAQYVAASSKPEQPAPTAQPEQAALAAQPAAPAVQAAAAPAVQTEAAHASPQPATLTETAPNAVAPPADSSADSAQLLQYVSYDLAALRQEVEELKAGMEQLKASQQQAARDAAKATDQKASDQNLRPAISAPLPRPAAPQPRKPTRSISQPHAAAAPPALPPPAAPYYAPRRPEYVSRQPDPQPQVMIDPSAEPELSPVPRPPMPVR
jgi:hypothetical protein